MKQSKLHLWLFKRNFNHKIHNPTLIKIEKKYIHNSMGKTWLFWSNALIASKVFEPDEAFRLISPVCTDHLIVSNWDLRWMKRKDLGVHETSPLCPYTFRRASLMRKKKIGLLNDGRRQWAECTMDLMANRGPKLRIFVVL